MTLAASYDYVIAGAGSAGCVVAARLAEDPDVSVLLVEAGGKARSLFVTMPAGNGFLFGNPKYDWGFYSEPQSGLGGRKIYYPRGKGLGGSSLLNGMIYIRGAAHDFDHWRQLGLDGWSYADVLPYFKRAESAPHRDDDFHGKTGPMHLTPANLFDTINKTFLTAAHQAGAALNPDFNGASQVGAGRFDTKVYRGRRQSTAAAYLSAPPSNLTIMTGCRVLSVEIAGTRATGLRLSTQEGPLSVRATREVILSLGAFASPQVLMLSGLGPADHLRGLGIKVVLDLPGVGADLQDHPNMPVQFGVKDPKLSLARFQRLDRAAILALRYLLLKDGPGAGPFWSTALFHGLRDKEIADLEIFFTPMVVQEGGFEKGWSLQNMLHIGRSILARGKTAAPGVQFDINLLRPQSRGVVRLRSTDPLAPPSIDPGYFQADQDLRDLVEGLRHIREVANQPAFLPVIGAELSPGKDRQSSADLQAAVRALATTGHHPVSTCRMGPDGDPGAVLDGQLRVRGLEGLRVVDASALPCQVSGNPNAAIIMMAEKAADMIRGKPLLAPQPLAGELP